MATSGCVILVPVGGPIEPGCEEGLRELERRGYPVRRVRGYSQVDVARNRMASDALADGFDELMWVDADVRFHPDDVARLQARREELQRAWADLEQLRASGRRQTFGTEQEA